MIDLILEILSKSTLLTCVLIFLAGILNYEEFLNEKKK